VKDKTPSLDIIVPVFNEIECINILFDRLISLRKLMSSKIDTSFLFIDDGSSDGSGNALLEIAKKHEFSKVVTLSRNFGHQIAVTAGLDFATADYVAIIDADLQDPPELLNEMFDEFENGYDIIYGQRKKREGETFFKKITASAFYRLLSYMCEVDIPKDTGDFRIMTKQVANELRRMRERHRFIRGMVPWVGFKSYAFEYDRQERFAGETKYPLSKMVKFAFDAIFSFSKKPLIYATRVGLLAMVLAILGAFYMVYLKLFTTAAVDGVTVVITTIVFMGGVQIMVLGMIGEYVARIFEEAKARPLYIADQVVNV
jgi:dolichol-phosphate mannosyltransferase